MDLQPINISEILQKYNIRLTKGLGQNFLLDDAILDRIVKAAEITAEDIVLEVGPGLGNLTRHLALAAKRVIAVELDKNLLPPMSEVLAPFDNVEIIQADIMQLPIDTVLKKSGYLVVANVPYYITSALIRHLLESKLKPARLILTIQKEVAQRICADEGNLSLLALSVQVYGMPELMSIIQARAFYPAPKIDSAVLRIKLYDQPLIPSVGLDTFFRLIKAGFSQKRKTLRNTLSAGMHWPKDITEKYLSAADVDPQRRAQTLSIEEWGKLVEQVNI
ncbi:MAG: 16S rRNA (adenine(1518)-N(6)/adenine(1519)-N(6))-dimethyltransferase RsmA [Chloroflexota bacterium]